MQTGPALSADPVLSSDDSVGHYVHFKSALLSGRLRTRFPVAA